MLDHDNEGPECKRRPQRAKGSDATMRSQQPCSDDGFLVRALQHHPGSCSHNIEKKYLASALLVASTCSALSLPDSVAFKSTSYCIDLVGSGIYECELGSSFHPGHGLRLSLNFAPTVYSRRLDYDTDILEQ